MKYGIVIGFLFLTFCTESPLIQSQNLGTLNTPSSIAVIPGTEFAVVINANINLDEPLGSMLAVNLDTLELLENTAVDIPSFGGQIFVDEARNRIYLPDREESLRVFEYSIPGQDGQAISFSEMEVPTPNVIEGQTILNGVATDDDPTQAILVPGTELGDLILVVNQVGTVTMIPAQDLNPEDLDSDSRVNGLRLVSAANFENSDNFPGRGASRISYSSFNELAYVTSPINNQIYVLDPDTQSVEAVVNLDTIASPIVGVREVLIDSAGKAYIAHSGLDSLIVMDFSSIQKNGILLEMVSPPLVALIPVGDGPEDLELNAAETLLYISNQNDDSVFLLDTTLLRVTQQTYLDEAKNPSRMILDESRNALFVLNAFSNSISVLDATTGTFQGEIE